jgi:hypothetical protein
MIAWIGKFQIQIAALIGIKFLSALVQTVFSLRLLTAAAVILFA